jgi:hypothetical protein
LDWSEIKILESFFLHQGDETPSSEWMIIQQKFRAEYFIISGVGSSFWIKSQSPIMLSESKFDLVNILKEVLPKDYDVKVTSVSDSVTPKCIEVCLMMKATESEKTFHRTEPIRIDSGLTDEEVEKVTLQAMTTLQNNNFVPVYSFLTDHASEYYSFFHQKRSILDNLKGAQ